MNAEHWQGTVGGFTSKIARLRDPGDSRQCVASNGSAGSGAEVAGEDAGDGSFDTAG